MVHVKQRQARRVYDYTPIPQQIINDLRALQIVGDPEPYPSDGRDWPSAKQERNNSYWRAYNKGYRVHTEQERPL